MKSLSRIGIGALVATALLVSASPLLGATRTFDFQDSSYGVADSACVDTPLPPLFNRAGYAVQTGTNVVAPAACGEGQLGGTLGNDSLLTAGIGGTNTNELRFSWVDPTLADQWARIPAYAAGGVTPKYVMPTIDIRPGSSVTMKIWVYTLDATEAENTSGQLEFALAIRETGMNLPLGENGGTTGSVEYVGVTTTTPTTKLPKGGVALNDDAINYYTVKWTFKADNTKVDVSVNGGAATELAVADFAGDSILSAAYNRAALDSLVIIKPDTDTVTKKLFVNIDDIVIDAPGIADPVQVQGPILQTAGKVTVKSINPNASEVKLYRNAVLSGSQTFTPGSAPSTYLFDPQTTNVGDVFTATQVVAGGESDPSAGVTVSSVIIMSENFDSYADKAAYDLVWKRKDLRTDYVQPGGYVVAASSTQEVTLNTITGATCAKSALIPGTSGDPGRYVAVAQIPGAGSTGFDGSDAIPLNVTWWMLSDPGTQHRNEVGIMGLTNHNIDTGKWKVLCSIGMNNNYPAANTDRFQCRTLAGSGTYYDMDNGPDGLGTEIALRQPAKWVKMQIRIKSTTVEFMIDNKIYKIATRPSPSSTYDSILLGAGITNSLQASWVDSITVSYGDPIVESYAAPVALVGGINSPISSTATSVALTGVDSNATNVKVFSTTPAGVTTQIGSKALTPPAAANQTVTVTAPGDGNLVQASQTIGGVEGCLSYARVTALANLVGNLKVSLGVKETTGLTGPVGTTSTVSGSVIEWVGTTTGSPPQGKPLIAGTGWQTITFNPATDPVRNFNAGNGILDCPSAPFYTLEHLALSIDSANPKPGPYTILMDQMESPAGNIFQNFESVATGTNYWIFRQPSFSGTTSGNLATTPNVVTVTDIEGSDGTKSLKVQFAFIDIATTRWLRLTASGTSPTLQQSPQIDLGTASARNSFSLRMKICGAADVTIGGPLKAGDTNVTVTGVATAADLTPDAIKVFVNGSLAGSAAGNGTSTVVVPLGAALVKGDKIAATQKVGGAEGCQSTTVTAGSGQNAALKMVLGIRENTALTGPVGADGGTTPAVIEMLGATAYAGATGPVGGKDVLVDAGWQDVVFTPGVDPVVSFSGGNGVLDGTYGVLEHIGIVSTGTDTGPYVLYIDNIESEGTVFGDMESFTAGDEVLCQEPTYSGTTGGNLLNAPVVSTIDDTKGDGSSKSVRLEWQFKQESTAQWVRATSNSVTPALLAGLGNPMVRLDQPIKLRVLLAPAGPACNAPQADLDGDNFVDGADYGLFAGCFNGTGNPINPGCECADLDGDNSVDGADYGLFAGCFNGTGNPSPCS